MNDEYPTAPAAGASATAAPTQPATLGELRSGQAFENRLVQLVEAEMTGHLEAGSVDEWHHKVLDDLVAHAVAVEILLIEDAGSARRAHLRASQATARLAIDELDKRAQEAEVVVAAAQARVGQAETRLLSAASDSSTVPAADGPGGPARLAQVSEQIAELRSARAATMQRAGITSPGALPEAIDIAEAQTASLNRRIEQQAKRVEQADAALARLESPHPDRSSIQDSNLRQHSAGPSIEDLTMGKAA